MRARISSPRPAAAWLAMALLVCTLSGCEALRKKKADGESSETEANGTTGEVTEGTTDEAVPGGVEAAPLESDFRRICAAVAAAAGGAEAARGRDDWHFSTAELSTLGQGAEFGGGAYRAAVDAVADYHRQLQEKGIQLIVVAVPPKAILYPDELSDEWKLSRRKVQRFDSYLQALYAELRSRGVNVIDPTAAMLDDRNAKTGRMYPQTDSRWSPRAAEIAARQAADALRSGGWITDDLRATGIANQESNLTLKGNLSAADAPSETVPARVVTRDSALVTPSSSAPLLVIGGTEALAFRESGAGLADQLVQELRVPFDLIAVEGPGRNVPRSRLLRKEVLTPGFLAGKKAVVWIVSGAEFLENDWLNVPASLQLQQGEEELRTADSLRRRAASDSAPIPIVNPGVNAPDPEGFSDPALQPRPEDLGLPR